MVKPIVAIVGRPNVGKSTLFNRLAGERLAVVDDIPGTTRDRLVAEAEWSGKVFDIIDTGGIDPTQTSSGKKGKSPPLSIGSADFIQEIRLQAEIAIQEADAVLFITDSESGVTHADREVAQILRRNQREVDGNLFPPVLLVVNKSENESRRQTATEFYELGIGEPHPVSAIHGTGTGDMLDALVSSFRESGIKEDDDDDTVRIAILGRPNVGKSTLLNRLVGEDRAIVSPIAGTTRDSIDSHLVFGDTKVTLIDTAGIRRRGKIEPGVEKYSVLRTIKAIERSHVTLLMVDAVDGVTSQDAHVAGYILDAWKSVVVVVNKWDAIAKDTYTINTYMDAVRRELSFLDYVPVLFISAITGQRVSKILPTALQVHNDRMTRLSTSQVNRILGYAQDIHPAPSRKGRHLKIFYGTQVRTDPPIFILYANYPELVHFTYLRFLENQIRENYPFLGTPIRIIVRPRSGDDDN